MAELNVQPKSKSGSLLAWILLGLGVLALIIWLVRGRGNDADDNAMNTTDTLTNNVSNQAQAGVNSVTAWWDNLDFNAPTLNYDEVTNKDIDVHGDANYAMYGMDETVLFDKYQASIRSTAADNLNQISASIKKRYNGAEVQVYGFADATGPEPANKEMAMQRANAVREWLVANSGIPQDRISVHSEGENNPVATNATEAGRQQNRRVLIVARSANANTAP